MTASPNEAGFHQPGEWESHVACWVAWPSDPALWPELAEVQASFVAMCRAIARPARQKPGERLEVLVQNQHALIDAEGALMGLKARFHVLPFGDIWMRDIAPVFLEDGKGRVASVRYHFNGWGAKYNYAGDDLTAARVQKLLPTMPAFENRLVLEGGAVESDGAGLCMTTRDVALNPNRNPGLSQGDVEANLVASLGAERVLWLDRGLLNDHTDGHIDNIARFIGRGRVLCMRPSGTDDPNREVLFEIERTLESFGVEVATIPSPGLVLGREGAPLPASYLNFYIANQSVVVPTFGSRHDDEALAAFERLFVGRTVLGVPAKVFLHEGGTVHCITQQQPAGLSQR